MRPLVYYCRWRGAKLRLRGRDNAAVWGELVYTTEKSGERVEPFRYDLERQAITLITDKGEIREVLDDMGVVVSSSAGDAPQ